MSLICTYAEFDFLFEWRFISACRRTLFLPSSPRTYEAVNAKSPLANNRLKLFYFVCTFHSNALTVKIDIGAIF
jgi:hypothetical protein